MYAVTTDDEELVTLLANTGKQEAAAPANKDDQRALEIAQVNFFFFVDRNQARGNFVINQKTMLSFI